MSLNGTWEFTTAPAREFQVDTASTGWKPIQVPGEPMMQGFVIKHDKEFCYRKIIQIPKDFAGKPIVLRFNGLYGFARVWVNGQYIREHHGGFTSWDCNITSLVTPGRTALLSVGVRDRLDDISFGSGYAKHPIGGILRSVELIALPEHHLRRLHTRVRFDSLYRNATLTVESVIDGPTTAMLTLFDPAGKDVALDLPLSILFKYATPDIPFLDRIGLVFLILSGVIIVVSLWESKGRHAKGIQLSRAEFRTDPVFTIGAIGSLVILAGLYYMFW